MWRIYSSPRFAIRHPREILLFWSQQDLDDAHETLNLYDDLERASNAAERKADAAPAAAPKPRRAPRKRA